MLPTFKTKSPELIWIWQGLSDLNTYVRLLHECQFSQQQTERLYRSQPDPQTVAEFEAHLEKK